MVAASDLPLPTGVTVTDAQATAALAIIEAYCNWDLEESSRTAVLDSCGSALLLLPALLVSAVASVTLNGVDRNGEAWPTLVDDVDFEWSQDGELVWLRDQCGWPVGKKRVTVAYTAGYASPLPGAILAVCAATAESVATTHVVQQQLDNVGGISQNRTYSSAVTGGTGLTSMECAVLDRYRIANVA